MISPYLTDVNIKITKNKLIQIDEGTNMTQRNYNTEKNQTSPTFETKNKKSKILKSLKPILIHYPVSSTEQTTNYTTIGSKFNKTAFTSSSERFKNSFKNSQEDNPGPGTYNIDNVTTLIKTFNSKGMGNGFISKTGRFDNEDKTLYYSQYKPGPGMYMIDRYNSLTNDIKNSINYRNIYEKNNILSKKQKEESPDMCKYNPQKIKTQSYLLENIYKRDKAGRFAFKINKNPGPGQYSYKYNINDLLKTKNPSYMFQSPVNKRVNILNKLKIKTNNDLTKDQFINKIKENEKNKDNPMKNLKQKAFLINNELLELNKEKMLLNEKNMNNKNQVKFFIGEKIDTSDIPKYEYIDITQKIPNFARAPPRWGKNNNYSNFVPGPAYYHPPLLENHLSFNRNEVDFIPSGNVMYKLKI